MKETQHPLTTFTAWTGQFIFALSWMVIVVSLGAISLLYLLLKQSKLHQVASIFYLVPAVTAMIAYYVFDQTLDTRQIFGMGITMFGVALVNFL